MTYRDVDPREDCEVLVDDAWWPGELRAWRRNAEGTWEGCVTWTRPENGMAANRLDWFPADRLRQDTTEREDPHG